MWPSHGRSRALAAPCGWSDSQEILDVTAAGWHRERPARCSQLGQRHSAACLPSRALTCSADAAVVRLRQFHPRQSRPPKQHGTLRSSSFCCTLTHSIETDIVGFSMPFRVLRVKRGMVGSIIGCFRDAGLCEPEIGRLSGRRMRCSHAGKVVPRGDPSGADIRPCWLALPVDEGG